MEIEAFSDEEAYTIFETMNDRGLPLSLPEMLKGYVLAKITHAGEQQAVNALWKARMHEMKSLSGDEEREDVREDIDFFKNWLRACHAETIRPGKKGAENQDYERIGNEFHRWVRDTNGPLKLKTSDDFVRFVKRDLDFYAGLTLAIRRAAQRLTPGWESIRYNEDRGFTLQTQVILAALDAMEREAWEAWEKSRGPIIRETVSAPREGEGRARTTTVRETRPAGDPAFLRLVLDVCDRRARLMGVDMTGTAGGPAHDGEPPKLTVVVNQPKDERPWHEKVFAATGVKIDPRPEDLERTARPAVGAMPA